MNTQSGTKNVKIHKSADVSKKVKIGKGTEIWNDVKVRDGASIGRNCMIHKGVYIDEQVDIGNNVKIQVNASIFKGVTIEDGVFIGPHVCFTNDKNPRAINPDGSNKKSGDWKVSNTLVKYGASIGANATILPGIMIGKWVLVGAGAVVTHDVPDFEIVVGSPAKQIGVANEKGEKIKNT